MTTMTLEAGSGGLAIQGVAAIEAMALDSLLAARSLPASLHTFALDCLQQAVLDGYEITEETLDATIEECSEILLHGELEI